MSNNELLPEKAGRIKVIVCDMTADARDFCDSAASYGLFCLI